MDVLYARVFENFKLHRLHNKVNDLSKQINNFIVDNSELDALTDKLEQFNIFDVLGIVHYEIRHSNSLAWFFEPQGHHGYGDKFFRRFLSRVLHESEKENNNITPADVELGEYNDLQVYREWKNIDLLLVSEKNKLCVIIENKIHAKESSGQLNRYLNSANDEWDDYNVIPLFLTLEGDDPSEEGQDLGYLPVSMTLVLELLVNIQIKFYVNQSDEAQGFVNNYIEILKRLTMQDEELSNLCKSIYRKHKSAIDLIVSYGGSSQVYEACREVLIESGNFDLDNNKPISFIQETRGMLFFVPKELANCMTEVELSRWKHIAFQYPICCWFKKRTKAEKLQITIEIGPVSDYKLRKKLLDVFDDGGFSIRKSAYNEGTFYTRVYSKNVNISNELESEDAFEDIKKVADKMLSSLMKQLAPKLSAIKDCF